MTTVIDHAAVRRWPRWGCECRELGREGGAPGVNAQAAADLFVGLRVPQKQESQIFEVFVWPKGGDRADGVSRTAVVEGWSLAPLLDFRFHCRSSVVGEEGFTEIVAGSYEDAAAKWMLQITEKPDGRPALYAGGGVWVWLATEDPGLAFEFVVKVERGRAEVMTAEQAENGEAGLFFTTGGFWALGDRRAEG